jgi:adenylosuccinate synthase
MFKRLILLSGPVGAGKSTLSMALERDLGVYVVKTRKLLLELASSEDARSNLQAAGEDLDRKTNGTWVANAIQRAADASEFGDNADVLVDSVRILPQIQSIREKYGARVFHVHLTASSEELARRYEERKKHAKGELESYDAVRADPTESQVEELGKVADFFIDTERSTAGDVLVRIASWLGFFGRGSDRLVALLVGGQYGSEGKGNIASYLSQEYDVLVRVGGPNAGHRVFLGGERESYAFHHLPSGTLHSSAQIIIAPGSTLRVHELMQEIAECTVDVKRMSIDPRAMIIDDADLEFEKKTLVKTIASTGRGVGAANARKMLRGANFDGTLNEGGVTLAKDVKELRPYIKETRALLDDHFRQGHRVFLEGTQGTGLSLHHGLYPHVTSRETSASGCLSDAGISASRVRRIIMVCRTYPIRVQDSDSGKTSGRMSKEISYGELSRRSGISVEELKAIEKTTTTKRQRRIGEFEWELVRKAASLNGPTDLALTFADYISIENRKAQRFEQLTPETIRFVEEIELVTGATVSLISTRFGHRAIIDRRKWW